MWTSAFYRLSSANVHPDQSTEKHWRVLQHLLPACHRSGGWLNVTFYGLEQAPEMFRFKTARVGSQQARLDSRLLTDWRLYNPAAFENIRTAGNGQLLAVVETHSNFLRTMMEAHQSAGLLHFIGRNDGHHPVGWRLGTVGVVEVVLCA